MKTNRIVGITNWAEVCHLARLMTNGLSRRPHEDHLQNGWHTFPQRIAAWPRLDLVYIATDSIGVREWVTNLDETATATQKSADGQYLGWSENQSLGFVFGSATSGARITIERFEGAWKVTFDGTPQEDAVKESDYLRRFMQVHMTKIMEIEVNRPELLVTKRD